MCLWNKIRARFGRGVDAGLAEEMRMHRAMLEERFRNVRRNLVFGETAVQGNRDSRGPRRIARRCRSNGNASQFDTCRLGCSYRRGNRGRHGEAAVVVER